MTRRIVSMRTLVGVLLIGLLVGAPVGSAQDNGEDGADLSSDEIVKQLKAVKEKVQRIGELYPDAVATKGGEITDQAAFDEALRLAEEARAAFGQQENTELFEAIQNRSPVVADSLKARVSQLVTAILQQRPVDAVTELIGKLIPDLNRAVIVAQSEVFPGDERQLKTEKAIREATQAVIGLVDQAVAQYEQGNVERAAGLANDAFFEFESNGLGPDSTLIDEQLENEVEGDISAFGPGASEDPGLEQLIRQEAPLEQVRAQRDTIVDGLRKIQELLIATLPKSRLGDVNGDGSLSITDALFIAQGSLGLRNVDEATADANCDGQLSITDALFVAQASLDLRELPEACPSS
ncbi:MAG: dockerin type I repeat-containing protein [Candidatus Bipolaricaulia bacterium]